MAVLILMVFWELYLRFSGFGVSCSVAGIMGWLGCGCEPGVRACSEDRQDGESQLSNRPQPGPFAP